jgi:Pyruvate/2-oxoacid:ferredoxin oxidoreductase delta subunit
MGKQRVNEFERLTEAECLQELKYLGMQIIPVAQITGSINRWREFDHRFRAEDADRFKLFSMRQAVEMDAVLPPISVYKIQDGYFVIDGNHRVVVARENGQIDIDAEVTELLPPPDSPEHIKWRERSRFTWKTGLTLDFFEIESYKRLLSYIRLYGRQQQKKQGENKPFHEIVRNWVFDVYQPLMAEIDRSQLVICYPEATRDDLFLFIIHHQLFKSRLQGRGVDLIEAVRDFQAVSGEPEHKIKRIFKSIVFRNRCKRKCLNCAEHCPEGLICERDGQMTITDQCDGCGACVGFCPDDNLVPYEEIKAL